jgi:hypothetical protein
VRWKYWRNRCARQCLPPPLFVTQKGCRSEFQDPPIKSFTSTRTFLVWYFRFQKSYAILLRRWSRTLRLKRLSKNWKNFWSSVGKWKHFKIWLNIHRMMIVFWAEIRYHFHWISPQRKSLVDQSKHELNQKERLFSLAIKRVNVTNIKNIFNCHIPKTKKLNCCFLHYFIFLSCLEHLI